MSLCNASRQLPIISNCSAVQVQNEVCLTINNQTTETLLLTGQTKNQCASISPSSIIVFSAIQGDSFDIIGQTTGIYYKTKLKDFVLSTTNWIITTTPDQYENFECKNIPWFLLSGGLGASAGLLGYIFRNKKKQLRNEKTYDCLIQSGDATFCKALVSQQPPIVPHASLFWFGIFLLVVFALISFIAGLFASGIIGSSATCKDCKNRGTDWSFTDVFPPGQTKTSWSSFQCKVLGFCKCRSGLQEQYCSLASKQNSNLSYQYGISTGNTKNYGCACQDQSNEIYQNCDSIVSGNVICIPCDINA